MQAEATHGKAQEWSVALYEWAKPAGAKENTKERGGGVGLERARRVVVTAKKQQINKHKNSKDDDGDDDDRRLSKS